MAFIIPFKKEPQFYQLGIVMSSLSNKIWITRKTRIYTEQRLLKKSSITQAVMIFYSFLLVALSIWVLVNPDKHLEIYLIVSSVAILISSIFISSQRYSERAMMIRNCYIRLDELCSRANILEKMNDEERISQVESEYTNILINVENHSDYDYLCMRYSLRNIEDSYLPKFTNHDYIRYILSKFIRGLIIIIIFVLPFIISYIMIKALKYVSIS